MFEKEAEEYLDTESKYLIEDNEGNIINIAKKVKQSFIDGAEFGYNKAKAETALLSQHILDLQKDKGNLVDKVRELEQQIEKMKKYIKACWVEENLNDYSSYITNSSDEFRDLVKEINDEVRNGR